MDDLDFSSLKPVADSSSSSGGLDFSGLKPVEQSTAMGAAARGAERGVLPAGGAMAGAGAGAELGAGLGALTGPFAEVGVPVGGFIGAIGGGFAGATGVSKAQEWALQHLPEGAKKMLGQDEATQQADVSEHPYASMTGELIPQLLAMRPGAVEKAAEDAGAFERVMSHPLAARGIGAGLGAGQEAVQEEATGEDIDPAKLAIAGGAGAFMNKTTPLGHRLTEFGAAPVRAVTGRGAAPPATPPAGEVPPPPPPGGAFPDDINNMFGGTPAPGAETTTEERPGATFQPAYDAHTGTYGVSGPGGAIIESGLNDLDTAEKKAANYELKASANDMLDTARAAAGSASVPKESAVTAWDNRSGPEPPPNIHGEAATPEGVPPPEPPRLTGAAEATPATSPYAMVDPDALTLDPKRFQYKESDERGVTGALAGVKQWDPNLADPVTAWQDNSGRLFVSNGHQRTDLAQRAKAGGQPDVQVPVKIYKESDGYTPDYMRALGAYQNIAQGSGTAIDAAKILRGKNSIPPDFQLPELPPKSQLVQDAQGLARLGPNAWQMVTNELVPPAYAAHVGRLIDDPAQQTAAMGVLAKAEPANSNQARIMVEDIRNSGFLNGAQDDVQGGLPGMEEAVAQSIYAERAQILDNSMRTLRKVGSTFNTAVEQEGTLTSAGNVLSREANVKGKSDNAQLLARIAADGTRKGPVSDALSAAAAELKDGQPIGAVTSRFLAAVRKIKPEDAEGRVQPSDTVSGAGPAEPQPAEVTPPPAGQWKPLPKDHAAYEGDGDQSPIHGLTQGDRELYLQRTVWPPTSATTQKAWTMWEKGTPGHEALYAGDTLADAKASAEKYLTDGQRIPSEQFVHTGRPMPHEVPPPAEDEGQGGLGFAENKQEDFGAFVERTRQQNAAAEIRVKDAMQSGGMRLTNGDRAVLFSKNATEGAPYRVTYFEKGEPTGHFEVTKTSELGSELRNFERQGFTAVPTGGRPSMDFEAASERFNAASAAFRKVQDAYRARQIGDNEFAAGQKVFNEALKQYDVAEAAERDRPVPKATVEKTPLGDQYVLPGAERTAQQAAAARPDLLTSAARQKPADEGLFAPKEPVQPKIPGFGEGEKTPTTYSDRLADFQKFAADKADTPHNALARDYVVDQAKATGHEYLATVDPKTGKVEFASTSDSKNGVAWSPELNARAEDPDARLVGHHSHPNDTALSAVDIATLQAPGLEWTVAHGVNGDTFAARLTPEAKARIAGLDRPAAEAELTNLFNEAAQTIKVRLGKLVDADALTREQANRAYTDLANRALSASGITEYMTTRTIDGLTPAQVRSIVRAASEGVGKQAEALGYKLPTKEITDDRIYRSPDAVLPDQAVGRLSEGHANQLAAGPPDSAAAGAGSAARVGAAPEGPAQGSLAGMGGGKQPPGGGEPPKPPSGGNLPLQPPGPPARQAPRGPLAVPVRAAETLGKALNDSMLGRFVRRGIGPGSFDYTAKIGARTLRQVFGDAYVREMQMREALAADRETLNNLSPEDRQAWAIKYDANQPQATPELQRIADNVKKVTDQSTRRLQSIGKLQDAVEFYLGRMWKPRGERADETTEQTVLSRLLAKQPLTGSKSFLKERYYDTYKDALDAGLEPVFDNPLDAHMFKLSEMNRYYAGTLAARAAKQSGFARFLKMGDPQTKDMMELEGPEFHRPTIMIKNADGTSSAVPEGAWFAPEGLARVYNNYSSRGLESTIAAEPAHMLRAFGNSMNMMQLGLSFFHPVFTTVEAQISRIGIGIDQAMRGQFGKAAGNIVGGISPTNWMSNLREGDRFIKSILDPTDATPEQQKLIDAFGAAGGRIWMQRILRPTEEGAINFFKSGEFGRAIQNAAKKYPDSAVRVALNVAGRTLESASAPIMDYLVPRQKMGIFSRMMQDFIQSRPDATHVEFINAAQQAWDSVDNRQGQMVYDNIFWNKTLKDLSFLTVRSVGWNMGSLREIGGGAVDFSKAGIDALGGRAPEWTRRMSYLIALPLMTGLYGAMFQYLATGKGPKELKDYFYPKTGFMTNGTKTSPSVEERVSMPSYMKDIYAWLLNPAQTAKNKLHPMVSSIAQMLDGRDYYGDIIANRDDPAVKQVEDVMRWAGSQFLPFSIKGTTRMFEERPGAQAIAGMLGITPAAGYITNPAAQARWEQRQHKEDVQKKNKRDAAEANVAPLRQASP